MDDGYTWKVNEGKKRGGYLESGCNLNGWPGKSTAKVVYAPRPEGSETTVGKGRKERGLEMGMNRGASSRPV